MNGWRKKLAVVLSTVVGAGGLFISPSRVQTEKASTPDVRLDLSSYGLPVNFFRADADMKCAGQIIGYRFVVWLSDESVAVGFNTSPNCRQSPNDKVNGSARLLVFDVEGVLKAKRDVPYLADGNGELVAQGEAKAGPSGTLLFQIESVNLDKEGRNESKSGVRLFDTNLKDVAELDGFLEQTTFVDHALVFQEGFTLTGPRTYSVLNGAPPVEIQRLKQDWPVGTMDRKFGEHGFAFMLCQQELQPGVYTSSKVIYTGAKRRCVMTAKAEDQTLWTVPLEVDDTAAIIGLLPDGSVAGQINVKGSAAGRLVIWKRDQTTELLPWMTGEYDGSIQSSTANMSRYAVFAIREDKHCNSFEKACSESGRLMIFDRRSQAPIVSRLFPKNGRVALSPDGLHYASFEAGELRIYSLAEPQ